MRVVSESKVTRYNGIGQVSDTDGHDTFYRAGTVLLRLELQCLFQYFGSASSLVSFRQPQCQHLIKSSP